MLTYWPAGAAVPLCMSNVDQLWPGDVLSPVPLAMPLTGQCTRFTVGIASNSHYRIAKSKLIALLTHLNVITFGGQLNCGQLIVANFQLVKQSSQLSGHQCDSFGGRTTHRQASQLVGRRAICINATCMATMCNALRKAHLDWTNWHN